MNKYFVVIFIASVLSSCSNKSESDQMQFLTKEAPGDYPLPFKESLIPEGMLIHKGSFSPDLQQYFYTISDKNFEQFDVYYIQQIENKWSEPQTAFFNTQYNEHGVSLSPDGNYLYFSSDRPTNIDGVLPTWHIWRSKKVDNEWTEPEFVDIPNLRNKLTSHASLTKSGTMYFHSSNADFSEMGIYYAEQKDGQFENGKKVAMEIVPEAGACTPYVSPEEDYLIYATIGAELDLMVSYNNGEGNWHNTKELNSKINDLGQGNPYVTPDNKYLFYTTGEHSEKKWKVNWVNIESELGNSQ